MIPIPAENRLLDRFSNGNGHNSALVREPQTGKKQHKTQNAHNNNNNNNNNDFVTGTIRFNPTTGFLRRGLLPLILRGKCSAPSSTVISLSQLSRPMTSGHHTFVELGRPLLTHKMPIREHAKHMYEPILYYFILSDANYTTHNMSVPLRYAKFPCDPETQQFPPNFHETKANKSSRIQNAIKMLPCKVVP